MGTVIGLGMGVGLLLIWSAFAVPREPAVRRPGLLERRVRAAGLPPDAVGSVRVAVLVLGLTAGVVMQEVSGALPVGVVFGIMAAAAPVSWLDVRARRRLREYAQVWPDAIDHLASAVRAGMSLPDAVAGLAVRGPAPLRPAFASFALDYQLTGRFGECLDRLKELLADPVGDRVVEGLRVAREVGGGELGRLLRHLSGYLRDEQRTRSELESRQAWAVNGAHTQVRWPPNLAMRRLLGPDVSVYVDHSVLTGAVNCVRETNRSRSAQDGRAPNPAVVDPALVLADECAEDLALPARRRLRPEPSPCDDVDRAVDLVADEPDAATEADGHVTLIPPEIDGLGPGGDWKGQEARPARIDDGAKETSPPIANDLEGASVAGQSCEDRERRAVRPVGVPHACSDDAAGLASRASVYPDKCRRVV